MATVERLAREAVAKGTADEAVKRAANIKPNDVCGYCGSRKPADQSCGCFDNGCQ